MAEYKLYITHEIPASPDDQYVAAVEGARIRKILSNHEVMGVLILNVEFDITIARVKRLERLFGATWGEKISVIY